LTKIKRKHFYFRRKPNEKSIGMAGISIQKLEWDSAFLGYNIGAVTIEGQSTETLMNLKEALASSDCDLIYLFNHAPGNLNEIEYLIPSAKWVDEKVTFVKSTIGKAETINTRKEIHSAYAANERLYNLVVQIGEFSRFFTDKKIGKDNYQRLYKTWLEKSLSRSICDEVCVWGNDEGLITLGEKKGRLDIGLIGVDFNSRGKGVGTQLLQHAEEYAMHKGFHDIQVVTQAQNTPAVNLYLKAGFHKESSVNVFHIWK